MRTLVLLCRLFSFVVKFGLMVTAVRRLICGNSCAGFFRCSSRCSCAQKLRGCLSCGGLARGQLIVFYGLIHRQRANPPVYDFADFLNDNNTHAGIVGVAISGESFAILRPGSDTVKPPPHIRALRRRDFVDQQPSPSHSEAV